MSYFIDLIGETPSYPCGICKRNIVSNHKSIRCNLCNFTIHTKCNKIEDKEFRKMKDDNIRYCLKCKEDILSFQRLTNQQSFNICKRHH